jgi:hypothetical protein
MHILVLWVPHHCLNTRTCSMIYCLFPNHSHHIHYSQVLSKTTRNQFASVLPNSANLVSVVHVFKGGASFIVLRMVGALRVVMKRKTCGGGEIGQEKMSNLSVMGSFSGGQMSTCLVDRITPESQGWKSQTRKDSHQFMEPFPLFLTWLDRI